MAWAPPTPTDLIERFPAFADVAQTAIQQALDEASLRVDDTWVDEPSYRLGMMLLAAHILTLDGQGTGAEAAAAANGMSTFQRAKSGTFEFDRGAKASSGGSDPFFDDLMSTAYGRRWAALAKRLFNGPLLLGGGYLLPGTFGGRGC